MPHSTATPAESPQATTPAPPQSVSRSKPPFWISSWSLGKDAEGNVVHHVTVAHSRETRKKKFVLITVPQAELAKIPSAEQRQILSSYVVKALIELGIATSAPAKV
jgi:hypothetical protein